MKKLNPEKLHALVDARVSADIACGKVGGADVDPIEYFSKSALETLSSNKDTGYEG